MRILFHSKVVDVEREDDLRDGGGINTLRSEHHVNRDNLELGGGQAGARRDATNGDDEPRVDAIHSDAAGQPLQGQADCLRCPIGYKVRVGSECTQLSISMLCSHSNDF